MLSKIIEHTVEHFVADSFLLDQVGQDRDATPTAFAFPSGGRPEDRSEAKSPDSAEVAALNHQITQLEHAVIEKEAAAYARGRREAEAEAQQRYSATMQATADKLAQSLKALADTRPRLCKEAETDLLRLSLAIAKRILHRELTMDPMALEALVKVCLDRLGRQDHLHVRVSPKLADAVQSVLTKVSARAIDVTSDPNLEAGDLIFETTRGQLDASMRTQLEEVERGLMDRLENRA